MRLVHFSHDPTLTPRSVTQTAIGPKPDGLWLSDEDDNGWSAWATGNEWALGKHAFEVTLSDDANVLTLSTAEAIRQFHAEYRTHLPGIPAGVLDDWAIDWPRVSEQYGGIIITPYQWRLRLDMKVGWYYTWDCASGCIWDATAIATIK